MTVAVGFVCINCVQVRNYSNLCAHLFHSNIGHYFLFYKSVFMKTLGFVTTDVFRHDGGIFGFMRKIMLAVAGITPEFGCETVIHCAVNKKLASEEGVGTGEMYRFCKPYLEGTNCIDSQKPKAMTLFEMSTKLVGL